jgi:hypothetical protein
MSHRASLLHAGLAQQQGQGHAGPFAATGQAVALLRVRARIAGIFAATIAGAFDEMNVGRRRKPLQVGQRVDQRLFHQAVNQQFVRGRIDIRNPGMMPLEME